MKCESCKHREKIITAFPCTSCLHNSNKLIDRFETAEPEVLSADLAAEKYNSESANEMTKIENAFFRIGYNYARKYWRLERDKELRPVIEMIKNWFRRGNADDWKAIDEFLKNIPTLNQR